MKKKLALILALVMIAMTLIACGGSGGSDHHRRQLDH